MKAKGGEYERFEKKMKNLEPNTRFVYFTGNLAHARMFRAEVERIARFTRACFELGYAQLFKARNADTGEFDHIIVLHEKLGMRKDGNGRFQEAERIGSALEVVR